MKDTYDMFSPHNRGRFGDNESNDTIRDTTSARSDLIDLDLVLHHRTPKAILVSADGSEPRAVWLPLIGYSPAQFEFTNRLTAGTRKDGREVEFAMVTVTLRKALAREKGLV